MRRSGSRFSVDLLVGGRSLLYWCVGPDPVRAGPGNEVVCLSTSDKGCLCSTGSPVHSG